MRNRPILILLHRLPSLAKVSFVDSLENELTFKIKRTFFPAFLIFAEELSLQYYFNHLSFFGKLKLLYSKFLSLTLLSRGLPTRQFFFPYAIEFSSDQISYPIRLNGLANSNVWISRTAVVSGVVPNCESEEIDWNLVRGRNNFLMMILKLKSRKKIKFFAPQLGLQVNHSGFVPIVKQEIYKFEGVKLVHSRNILQDKELLFPVLASKSTFAGWPTFDPYYHDDRLMLMPSTFKSSYDSGIFFRFRNNWFHFLVETMSSLVKFESQLRNQDIILPKGTFPQIVEALRLFSPASLIYTSYLDEINFAHLTVIDLDNTANLEFRERKAELNQLRRFINSNIQYRTNQSFEKIYIKRSANLFRNLINRDSVENYLSDLGYACLDLGEKAFADQVSIIRNASVIVAETGAALTNIVFAHQNCHVIELMPERSDSVYPRLINLMGLKYDVVETRAVGMDKYKIDMQDLYALNL